MFQSPSNMIEGDWNMIKGTVEGRIKEQRRVKEQARHAEGQWHVFFTVRNIPVDSHTWLDS